MYIRTSWTARPLSAEQTNRMMASWGKLEASLASNPSMERVCWFINADGSGGVTVAKVTDPDAAAAIGLEQSLINATCGNSIWDSIAGIHGRMYTRFQSTLFAMLPTCLVPSRLHYIKCVTPMGSLEVDWRN